MMSRLFRHLFASPLSLRRVLPPASMKKIEDAIGASEKTHSGELRFAVEQHLNAGQIFKKITARQRAVEVFSQLRIWDTEENTGVLIYLLLADRSLEIIADRGIHKKVGEGAWTKIATEMESKFKQGDFETGVIYGIQQISTLLAKNFPADANNKNELPNQPVTM